MALAGGLRRVFHIPVTNRITRQASLTEKSALKFKQVLYSTQSRFAKKESLISVRKAVISVCCLGIGGGVYGYMTAMPTRKDRILSPKISENGDSTLSFDIPEIEPSRKVDGPATQIGLHLTLYQYQTCPFCCKVRAFLGYYGIPYDIVEVNPVLKQQLRFSNYKKVPIVIADNQISGDKHQLKDSSLIISILGTYLLDLKGGLQNVLRYYVPVGYTNEEGIQVTEVTNKYFLMYGSRKLEGKAYDDISRERHWRRWADKEFVHVLSPNVYRTYEEAKQAFNYFSDVGEWEKNFSYFERLVVIYVGATAMYFIGKKLKKKYALKDDVRESFYDMCRLWMTEIGSKEKFLGGNVPNLADLEIYGLLSSIEGCPAFQDATTNTNIGTWYYRVKEAVQNHHGYSSLSLPKS